MNEIYEQCPICGGCYVLGHICSKEEKENMVHRDIIRINCQNKKLIRRVAELETQLDLNNVRPGKNI